MFKTFQRVIVGAILLGALSCSRSPQVYVAKGNRFAAEHKYKDASLQYQKALQKDPQFGEAVYRLALSELEQQKGREGYRLLSRAVELMPDNQEVKSKLADVSLALYWSDPRRPKAPYEKVVKLADELLAKNSNSFDGLRLKGAQAMLDRQPKLAVEYYSKANIVEPMQPGLVAEFVQALLADGQGQSAERLALELISRDRTYAPIYDILYNHYLRQNRAADAEELLKNKVANKPEDANSRLQLASHYARASKPDQMKATLQRFLDDPKTFPKGRLQVAELYSELGDWQSALEQFEEGARLNTNPPDKLSYEKGVVNALIALGKREDASKRLDSLVREYPKNREIKVMQSSVWLLSRQPAQIKAAIVQLEDLTKQNPEDVGPRYMLAQAYREIQNWDSARVQFQEIIKRHKGSLEARLGLAEIGLAQNKPDVTLTYADEILATDGENRRARLLRSAALISMRNYPQAHNELNRVLRASPQDRDAQVQAGTLAILEKRHKDAESLFSKLRLGGTQDIRSSAGLVDVYIADNHYDKAIQLLNEDLKRSPDSTALRRLLATTATRAGRYDIALEQYSKLLAVEPNSPDLYMRMARVYELKADRLGAIAHLEKAKQLSPKDPGPAALLGTFLQLAGRLDEAKANYQQVLQLQPDNAMALNNLAYLLADTGNLDEALQLAQRAQQKRPGDLDFADTLGWIYLKKNMSDSALQIFSIGVRKQPDNPTFRYHLGLALLQKGDREKARSELHTALKKNPAKDEEAKIREAIARIG